MKLCIVKKIVFKKNFNYKVAQTVIINNFIIESLFKILLVWPLLRRFGSKLLS